MPSASPAVALPHVTTTPTTTTTTTAPPTTTSTDPGTLPQTNQFPAAQTPQFQAEMSDLWQGVVTGSVTPALPAFFPQSAYVQLKTGIANPAGDWQSRLVADYGLDLAAAHALLGSDPAQATFLSVSVPEQYGHWIPPGVCANGIGYYEVANSRVLYQLDGQTRSFGIASLISWRGLWYVVHLGAILRSGSGGQVDEPALGPGACRRLRRPVDLRGVGSNGQPGAITDNPANPGVSSAATMAADVGGLGSSASSKKIVVSSRVATDSALSPTKDWRWSPPCSTTMALAGACAASNTCVDRG